MRGLTAALIAVASLSLGVTAASATFPGSNGKIAFTRDNAPPFSSVWLVDPDGQNQIRITDGPNIVDFNPSPSFSADGEWIAFAHFTGGDSEIFVMAADGANPVQLTDNSVEDTGPAFTPDGQRIVYATRAFGGGDLDIAVMNADGTGPSPLTNSPMNDSQPNVSSNGQIVFTRDSGVSADVYSMDADGQNQIPLASTSEEEITPSWSPDGRQILFARGDGSPREIFVMDADGQNPTPMTSNGFNNLYPSFSPDASRVVFTSFAGSSTDMVIMDAAPGSPVSTLVGGDGLDYWTNWQPLNPPEIDLTAGTQKSPKAVTVTVVSRNENATATLDGTVTAKKPKPKASASKKKTVELDAVTVALQAGVPATVEIPVAGKGKKLIKKSLKAGKKPKGTITATATDDLQASASDSQDVAYKKKKKK